MSGLLDIEIKRANDKENEVKVFCTKHLPMLVLQETSFPGARSPGNEPTVVIGS